MCDHCGCSQTPHRPTHREQVGVHRSLLEANDHQARDNRAHLDEAGVLGLNLMSSPGSGKTSLIESLANRLRGRWRIGAIEGDLATDRDAARLAALGMPVHQITTGSTCHLDAAMVHEALHALPIAGLDLLVVENVGNLVCPGLFDLGCHLNGVLLSVTEGDDKIAKYPVVFHHADFLCITKTDLLPHVEFDVAQPAREARALRPELSVFEISARTGSGLDDLIGYLERARG